MTTICDDLIAKVRIPFHQTRTLLSPQRWARDRTDTNTVGQRHGSPTNHPTVTLICVKPPVICLKNMKLIIQTIVTAQGLVIAPVTNEIVNQTKKLVITVAIEAGTQVGVLQGILWTKHQKAIAPATVWEASLPCSDKALLQVNKRSQRMTFSSIYPASFPSANKTPQNCASLVLSQLSFPNHHLPVLVARSLDLLLSPLNLRFSNAFNSGQWPFIYAYFMCLKVKL